MQYLQEEGLLQRLRAPRAGAAERRPDRGDGAARDARRAALADLDATWRKWVMTLSFGDIGALSLPGVLRRCGCCSPSPPRTCVAWGAVGFLWFRLDERVGRARPPRHRAGRAARARSCQRPTGSRCSPRRARASSSAARPHGIAAYVAKTAVKPRRRERVGRGARRRRRAAWCADVVRERAALRAGRAARGGARAHANPLEWTTPAHRARAPAPGARRRRATSWWRSTSRCSLPRNEGTDGYTRGGGAFAARVIGFRDGERLARAAARSA